MNIIRFPTTVTALCVAIIAALGTPFASASPYPAIYAFGDSLSDAGNFSASTLGVVPAPPYSGGRFSNGPVWVQFLGALLGSGPVDPSLRGGTDFAWGLAETGSTPVHQLSPRDLPAQFSQFVSQVPVPQPGALYTVWAGANDLLNILSTPNLTPAAAATAVLYAVANVDAFVSNLAGRGAQNLLVLNVPNLGLTPSVLREGLGPSQEATLLSQWFNGWLIPVRVGADSPGDSQRAEVPIRSRQASSRRTEATDGRSSDGHTNRPLGCGASIDCRQVPGRGAGSPTPGACVGSG